MRVYKKEILLFVLMNICGLYIVKNSYAVDSNMQSGKNIKEKAMTPSVQPNGLKIQDVKIGTGVEAKKGDFVEVHYTGTLESGVVFDSSKKRNQPFKFKLGTGQVIKGWDEGVAGMKVGGFRKLTIPAPLAYGEKGIGSIPANSTLLFDVELLNIGK